MSGAWRVAGVTLVCVLVAVALSPRVAYATSYSTAVLADSPAWYVPGDNLSGSTLAASAGPNAGCFNMADSATGFVTGSTHSVHPSSSVANCVATSPPGSWTGAYTLEAWYDSAGGTQQSYVMIRGSHGGGDFYFDLGSDSGGAFAHLYPLGGGSEVTVHCSGAAGATGVHMVAGELSGGTLTAYLDGASCGSASASVSSGPASWCTYGWSIGSRVDCSATTMNTVSTTTRVGQVAYFSHAIGASEIALHYGSGHPGPVAHVSCSPGYKVLKQGASYTLTCTSVDAYGNDVTGTDSYQIWNVGHPRVECDLASVYPAAMVGNTTSCKGLVTGTTRLDIYSNGLNVHWFGVVLVVGASNRFALFVDPAAGVVGQQFTFSSESFDVDGNDTTATDSWTITNADSHRTCVAGGAGTGGVTQQCSWNAAGTYVVVGQDSFGFSASRSVDVAVVPAASVACQWTDPSQCFQQIWNAVTSLPFQLIGGLVQALFVSSQGNTFPDFSSIQLVPYVSCRAGEAPSAGDGVHCYPFPFSIPLQLYAVWGAINVTPVTPTLDYHVYIPPYIDRHQTIDPTIVLTSTVMSWLRGVEYVLFVAALGLAVRKYVQLFGVA